MAERITLVNTETKEQLILYSADARALLANQVKDRKKDGKPLAWKVLLPGTLEKPQDPSQEAVAEDQAKIQRGGPQDPQEALEAEVLETAAQTAEELQEGAQPAEEDLLR